MSETTFDVCFRGLCGIVHTEAPASLPVILIDTEKISGMEAHHPYLAIEERYLIEGSAKPDILAGRMALWRLNDKAVTVAPGVTLAPAQVKLVHPTPPVAEYPGDPTDEQSACWLPRVTRACGEARLLDPALRLKPGTGPAPPIQAGLVSLDRGWLIADPDGPSAGRWVWKLRENVHQHMADMAVCRSRVVSGQPAIQLSNLESGVGEGLIALQPAGERIEIHVTNLPSTLSGPADHMHHFDAYYELLDRPPAERPTPMRLYPFGAMDDGDPIVHAHSFGTNKCSPGQIP